MGEKLEKGTILVVAVGFILGALIFILMGNGIIYFANLSSEPSGVALGWSLVETGYGIITVLLLLFILAVGYLIYQRNSSS